MDRNEQKYGGSGWVISLEPLSRHFLVDLISLSKLVLFCSYFIQIIHDLLVHAEIKQNIRKIK